MRLDDNGVELDTVLTAGLVGMQVCDSGDKTLSADGKGDTVKPVVAWWIFAKKDESEGGVFCPEERETEQDPPSIGPTIGRGVVRNDIVYE